jgi:hypothetical protein
MKVNEIITETTAGGMATVVASTGPMIKRPNPSVYRTSKKGKKRTNEAPLRPDWDAAALSSDTSYASRRDYVLARAPRIGAGSSRIAVEIEYQGRPTILKISKNPKGDAQNQREVDVLDDSVLSNLGILIPLIDHDPKNDPPTWIHTEKAEKASEKKLCSLIKCKSLSQLISLTEILMGKKRSVNYSTEMEKLKQEGMTEADLDTLTEYVHDLADLASADVMLGDLDRATNWGIYQGRPVIIDVGLDQTVYDQHYSRANRGGR